MSIYTIYGCTNGEYVYKYDWEESIWVKLISSGKRKWRAICCSDDGNIVISCAFNDFIYKSIDGGTTWNPVTLSLSKRDWTGICCSADAKTIIACATWNLYGPGDNEFAKGDYVYISTNSGTSWTKIPDIGRNSNGKSLWAAISCSSGFVDELLTEESPIVIAVAELYGNAWVSKDSGVTWINSSFISLTFKTNNFNTSDICVSSTGEVITLVTIPSGKDIGNAYTSVDSGDTWAYRFPLNQTSNCVTCSADGTIIAVGTNDNYIYTSTDSGFSFSQQFSSGLNKWSTITISPDNDLYVAAVYGGFTYGSVDGINWQISDDNESIEKQWMDTCVAKGS